MIDLYYNHIQSITKQIEIKINNYKWSCWFEYVIDWSEVIEINWKRKKRLSELTLVYHDLYSIGFKWIRTRNCWFKGMKWWLVGTHWVARQITQHWWRWILWNWFGNIRMGGCVRVKWSNCENHLQVSLEEFVECSYETNQENRVFGSRSNVRKESNS